MVNVFLDTSIVISKEFGSQHTKKKINQMIGDLNKISTSFIKKEINCSLLKDAIFLYSMLIEEMNLSAVFERLQRYPLTDRRRKRCLAFFSKVTNERQLRLEDAITRLESLINGLNVLLFKDISLIKTKTNCTLAEAEIEKVDQIYKISLYCRRDSAECDLGKFMKENKDSLTEISFQKDLEPKLSRLLSELVDDFSIAKGRNCSILGDVIICLESPNNYPIYSTNIKDFIPICRALRKKFIGIEF